MSIRRTILSGRVVAGIVAVGVIMAVAAGSAEAKDIRYKDRVAGTVAPALFDFNGDSVTGGSGTLDGRSNRGPVNGGFVAEFNPLALAPDAACPTGTLKLPLIVASGARGLLGTDEQVFLMDTPEASLFCLNPTTGVFSIHTEGNFTGGTGRFAGATGTYKVNGMGTILLSDPSGRSFIAFTFETNGTVITPE